MSRRAFLYGLGISGIALSMMATPTLAFAAPAPIHSFDNVEGSILYCDFLYEDQSVQYSNVESHFKTIMNYRPQDPASGVQINTSDAICINKDFWPGDKWSIDNAFKAVFNQAILDSTNGKRYTLEVTCTHIELENLTKGSENVFTNSSNLAIFRYDKELGSLILYSPGKSGGHFYVEGQYTFHCRVLDDSGNLVNKPVNLRFDDFDTDLDFNSIAEGVKFNSGILRSYVDENTYLNISESNTKFSATNVETSVARNDIAQDRVVVVTTGGEFEFTMFVPNCGCSIFSSSYGQPNHVVTPIKSAVTQKVYT